MHARLRRSGGEGPMIEAETGVAWPRLRWRTAAGVSDGERVLPEETPVALVHDGSTTAVMMATPADLEDFGVGFSLSEGICERADEIAGLEATASDLGVEVRIWLTHDRSS